MSTEPSALLVSWREELPTLSGRTVTLREPAGRDGGALVDLLSIHDATSFGLEEPVAEAGIHRLIARLIAERRQGRSFSYLVTRAATGAPAGLFTVRQLDPTFEAAEWECTLAPSARGTGVFVEAARLVGSFAFGLVGTSRLEARVPATSARGQGALRKIGAVQEGVLRQSLRRGDQYVDQTLWSILREDWGEARLPAAPGVH